MKALSPNRIIERRLYEKIHAAMPILCIDLAIMRDLKILLVERNIEPCRGEWWFPGGRLHRWESPEDAVERIALEEVGLKVTPLWFAGYFDGRFNSDPFGHGQGTHTVSLVFACATNTGKAKVDTNHGGYVWWDGVKQVGKVQETMEWITEVVLRGRGGRLQ